MADVALPPSGWTFEYMSIERPRRDRPVFRPVVPIRHPSDSTSALLALVDSGSEHTLAPRWLADEFGVDLAGCDDRLLLGVGGHSVEALFTGVELRLEPPALRDGSSIAWHAEVGFVDHWRAEFYLILGQIGFFDHFTVTMNRRLLTVVVRPIDGEP